MAKQSGMIAFAEKYAQSKVDAAQRLTCQFMIDTLQMTLHQTEGWGYDRIMRLTEAWFQTRDEYRPVLNSNDPAADVMQEHMDRVMAQIISAGMSSSCGLVRRLADASLHIVPRLASGGCKPMPR